MHIGFFSPRNLSPLHPRLLAFRKYFIKKGHTVEFINATSPDPTIHSRINWITLWFFDWLAIRHCKSLLKNFDMVFVGDLKYLPLCKTSVRQKKVTVYDTIDHNVELRMYQLRKKVPLLRMFSWPISVIFRWVERTLAMPCHAITVNSISLKNYFNSNTHILYYSSPFEELPFINQANHPPAIVYLGVFSEEKGSAEITELARTLHIPLFIFGDIDSEKTRNAVTSLPHVTVSPRIASGELQQKIEELMRTYFLFGVSLIKPAHYSYEVQEANKDIDYLALGIPIIGNNRVPTREKIEMGCGLFYNDSTLAQAIHDESIKKSMSEKCKEVYNATYHSRHFDEVLDRIMPS